MMTNSVRRTLDPDEVIHIVGFWQWLPDLLHVRIPRALCGKSMAGEGPEWDNTPLRPTCVERDGGTWMFSSLRRWRFGGGR